MLFYGVGLSRGVAAQALVQWTLTIILFFLCVLYPSLVPKCQWHPRLYNSRGCLELQLQHVEQKNGIHS